MSFYHGHRYESIRLTISVGRNVDLLGKALEIAAKRVFDLTGYSVFMQVGGPTPKLCGMTDTWR